VIDAAARKMRRLTLVTWKGFAIWGIGNMLAELIASLQDRDGIFRAFPFPTGFQLITAWC
jgi:hypothetical protein